MPDLDTGYPVPTGIGNVTLANETGEMVDRIPRSGRGLFQRQGGIVTRVFGRGDVGEQFVNETRGIDERSDTSVQVSS
jgi:hypothetical protein